MQIRFKEILLRSVKELWESRWNPALERCLHERQAPNLSALTIILDDDVAVFSWKVFENMLALVKIVFVRPRLGAAFWGPSVRLCAVGF